MDIFTLFGNVNIAQNIFPGLWNLEDQLRPVKNRIKVLPCALILIHRLISVLLFICDGIVIYGAFASYSDNVTSTDNILAVVIFIDNYGPLLVHLTLLAVTRRPVPLLAAVHRIDELLFKGYSLTINYRTAKRKFQYDCVLFVGGLTAIMGNQLLSYILLQTEWYTKFIVLYFSYVWAIFIFDLVVYSTLISILRSQIRVMSKNLQLISEIHRISFGQLLRAAIESLNKIGNAIMFIFVTVSSFYTTLFCFATLRLFESYSGSIDWYYLMGSALFVIHLVALNIYLVTNACSLKRDLLSLFRMIDKDSKDYGSVGVWARMATLDLNYNIILCPSR